MTQGRVDNHRDLRVWRLGMELAADVYRITAQLPIEERYGLTSQLRRAAASIPANIAEGAGRHSAKEFARFLSIARGSLAELETHVLLCEQLELLTRSEQIHAKIRGIRLMLSALRSKVLKRDR